jgi:hypothetical protein
MVYGGRFQESPRLLYKKQDKGASRCASIFELSRGIDLEAVFKTVYGIEAAVELTGRY